MFFGEHELTIDPKNRMLVPSDIRKQINPGRDGDAFFLVPGVNDRPWLYVERYYEELVNRQRRELTPDEDQLAYDRMNLAMAFRLEWDKQGRILFPEKWFKRAGISRDITLIGSADHLELWNRSDWEVERELLNAKRAEIALKVRQAREQQARLQQQQSPSP